MPDINLIIRTVDNYLLKTGKDSIGPVEANNMLAEFDVLSDSKDKRGKPLRDLLRKGLFPHAFQQRGKDSPWIIPHSTMVKRNEGLAIPPQKAAKVKPSQRASVGTGNHETLMNETRYKSVQVINTLITHSPGIYCIRVCDVASLPQPYSMSLTNRGHNILYIGIATKSLKSRLLGQELGTKGNGTFFRSIGAVLGYRPLKGSLIDKSNKRNYKFPSDKQIQIMDWVNRCLVVNWVECNSNLEAIERQLIGQYQPLLNLDHNPAALDILRLERAECFMIANS